MSLVAGSSGMRSSGRWVEGGPAVASGGSVTVFGVSVSWGGRVGRALVVAGGTVGGWARRLVRGVGLVGRGSFWVPGTDWLVGSVWDVCWFAGSWGTGSEPPPQAARRMVRMRAVRVDVARVFIFRMGGGFLIKFSYSLD